MAKTNANKEKVIELLNEARASELTAILQYMSQHYELEDQDFGKPALMFKTIAIDEMRHAELFANRILFLGGTPTSTPDGKEKKGQELEQMLDTNHELETGAVAMYNDHAKKCAELGDNISRDLFETILAQEENHLDQFDNINKHIKKLGAAYLATLAGGQAEPAGGAGTPGQA
ncbi:MAG TPA: bacterioferritin [Candidatus Brocadiia bacterium]|nr:bacterioferritin [Candidatus Brocadiia bacterium]